MRSLLCLIMVDRLRPRKVKLGESWFETIEDDSKKKRIIVGGHKSSASGCHS